MTSTTSSAAAPGAVLVLGGTGKVGSRLCARLASSSIPYLCGSRSGAGPHGVAFDWTDSSTWRRALAAAQPGKPGGGGAAGVRAAFLVAQTGVLDAAPRVVDFVDFAREKGVKRFVLLSVSSIEEGGPVMGKVHAYLRELGERGNVEWAVLRPTWFQENFSKHAKHVKSIREESKVYSATGDGKVPFVSVEDIANCAFQALTSVEPPNTDYVILGPELLSYDDVAGILSEVLGTRIVHVDLSSSELEDLHLSFGLAEDYAKLMSAMDTAIKHGSENRTNDVVLTMTGKKARSFRTFAEDAKSTWQ